MKRNFVLFIASDIISQFSAGLILVALNWYIVDVYHSNSLVAMVANINVAVGLLISLVAVGLFKKMNAKWIAIFSYCFRIFFIVLPLALFKLGIDAPFVIYLLALSGGIGWNLYFPASKDILNSFTVGKNALSINSFAEISMQVGLLFATLFSGILYRYIGFDNILILGTILFVLALGIFSLVKYTATTATDLVNKPRLFSYLAKQKWLILLGLVMYIPFVGVNVINTALPGYIKEHLAGNSINYGFTDTMYGVGACLASFLLPVFVKGIDRKKLVAILFVIATVLGVILVLNQRLSLAAGYIFLLGLIDPAIRTIIYTRTTELVPATLLGTIMSFWNFINLLFQFGANYSVGKIMDGIGPQWGFIIYAGLMLLGLLIFIGIRKLYEKEI